MKHSKLYISDIFFSNSSYRSNIAKLNNTIIEPSNWKSKRAEYPLFSLYDEFNLLNGKEDEIRKSYYTEEEIIHSGSFTMSDLFLEAAEKLRSTIPDLTPKIRYLLNIHEATEPSITLTPSLKVKKLLEFKKTIPFSISHTGSVGIFKAIDLLENFKVNNREVFPSMIILGDQISPPQPRSFFKMFPKGDLATSMLLDNEPMEWEIVEYSSSFKDLIDKNPYHWTDKDFYQFNLKFMLEINKSIDSFSQSISGKNVRWVISQNLSSDFISQVRLKTTHIGSFYRRESVPYCNLLNADCFYSLKELESKEKIRPGDYIYLILAGPLHQIGHLLIKKR